MKIWVNTSEDAEIMDEEECLKTAKPATMEDVAALRELAVERARDWNYYIPTFYRMDDNIIFYLAGPFEG